MEKDFYFESLCPKNMGCGGVMALVLILMLLLLSGCTTVRTVEVEKVRTDTVWENHTARDSIYIERHDSAVIYIKGDTVTIDRWHWRDRWRDRVVTDTIYKSKTDTVTIIRPAADAAGTVSLTWWQQTRIKIANVVLWLITLSGMCFLFLLLRKFKP